MAKTRRAYTGGAASTTTSSVIAASGTTSFTITAYTGWPYGSDPFYVVVEPGTANEEKILVTRTGSTDTTINVYATPSVAANRGADGTSAVAHSSGVTVFPVFTALDADEANELTSAFGSKGDLVSYGSSTFETLGVGSDDTVLIADSGEASGLKWGSVDTAQLAAGAVETAKIDDLAVTGPKLANATVETKTASYTLVAGDRNKRIVMNNAGATTITVDDSVFSAGDVVWLHNIGAGTCTVTAGTATVNTAASLDLAQWEGGSLYFTSASSAIFFRGPAAGVGTANFTDTETGTYSSGGTNYKYLTFTSSGTITIDTAGLADILVIGGGGGGGSARGGGGGAGGYLEVTGAYLPVGTLTVVVGAGGTGAAPGLSGPYAIYIGQNGNGSRLDSYYALGGGGAASLQSGHGTSHGGGNGGSGGAGTENGGAGGAGMSGQGNAGGNGGGNTTGGGGGGGASAAGQNYSSGGDGGNGTSSSITGSAVTRAGGGGGGGISPGSGGTGGGGNGTSNNTTAGAGTANTGGGGGGAGFASGGGGRGGNGGSGVVIVRVEV